MHFSFMLKIFTKEYPKQLCNVISFYFQNILTYFHIPYSKCLIESLWIRNVYLMCTLAVYANAL